MIYNDISALTVIETDEEWDVVSHDVIKQYNISSPTDSIYFSKDAKIYGLICYSDVILSDPVMINKHFSFITNEDYLYIQKFLNDHPSITFLPKLDSEGRLLGEYCQKDFYFFLEAVLDSIYSENTLKALHVFDNHELKGRNLKLALVCPTPKQAKPFAITKKLHAYLNSIGYRVDLVDSVEALNIDEYDFALFANAYTWFPYYPHGERDFYFHKKIDVSRFLTVNNDISAIEIIKSKGVTPITLYFDTKNHPYCQSLREEIFKENYPLLQASPRDNVYVKLKERFFEEHYSPSYVESIKSINSIPRHSVNGCSFFSKYSSDCFNANENGERKTFYQPKEYDRTIFCFGPCLITGNYVEDKHTLESFLQKKMVDSGMSNVRVVNYGDFNNCTKKMLYILEKEAKPGDIFVYMSDTFYKTEKNISINLCDFIEENRLPSHYFTNLFIHCNYRAQEVYANGIYKRIFPLLNQKESTDKENLSPQNKDIDLDNYLREYFSDFPSNTEKNIGAIVMNCNPFTLGHRYLIEQASALCDILIIFVVSSNESIFSFNTRFSMVYEGTKDLANVRVVPSGPLILSSNIFPEYFMKLENESTFANAKKDIEIFAKKIAPALGIKTRFVGEELNDVVTNHYNDAMKEILPKHGINLIEIPRISEGGLPISGTRVRECIKAGDYEGLSRLVPLATLNLIK